MVSADIISELAGVPVNCLAFQHLSCDLCVDRRSMTICHVFLYLNCLVIAKDLYHDHAMLKGDHGFFIRTDIWHLAD